MVAAVAGTTTLVAAGLIGSPARDERFQAKQVIVSPAGGDAVRIREIVDIDFADEARRGYQRLIPNDFGVPDRRDGQLARRARRRLAWSTRAPTTGSASATRT